jgi:glutathionylspermidine synthase
MQRVVAPPRPDWRARAEALGFTYHSADGEPYWDESAYLAFTLREIEEDIEAPTAEIEAMCFAFVERAVRDEAILRRLAIPPEHWATVAESWARKDRNLYGRLDLAYDGKGPGKLLEYYADTPTSLYEAAVFQWVWLEEAMAQHLIPERCDQYNSIHERLIAAWPEVKPGARRLHLCSVADSPEDEGTVAYLADCARQAGLETVQMVMEEIGVSDDGRFADMDSNAIELLFKLYPWEWIFREPFGAKVRAAPTTFVEPAWKAVLSNKGLLPFLWEMDPGHPNLLPSFFEGDPRAADLSGDVVRKPLLSREGANVEVRHAGTVLESGQGPYGAEGFVLQQAVSLPNFGSGFVVLGSWLVASQPCGLGVRESATRITGNTARFLPHVILD